MDLSFYVAAVGANAQQNRLNTISNNMANLQTEGYKAQSAGFVDLLYNKYYKGTEEDPEVGCGARVEKTDILFETGGMMTTDAPFDFALSGDGFFAVYDKGTDKIYYTRNGHFTMSNYGENVFYLANDQGYLMLDRNFGLVSVDPENVMADIEPGIFDFNSKEGFLLKGSNLYEPAPQNGDPFVKEDAIASRGRLEMANVDLAYEMTRMIESQRAFQLSLRMLQTSDEIEGTINQLRG